MSILIFLVSSVMLIISVFYTRLFSILYWHTNAFAILSLALLGLASAGLAVYFKPQWFPQEKTRQRLAWLVPAFAISLLVSYQGILATSRVGHVALSNLAKLVPAASMALIPFFCGGLIVTLILARFHEQVSRLYFFDMLGASLGAVISLALIDYFSGPPLILWLGLVLAATATVMSQRWNEKKALVFSAATTVLFIAYITVPALHSQMTILHAKGHREAPSKLEKWAPAARVKVHGNRFQLDSGVVTPILPFNGDLKSVRYLKRNILQLGYHLGPYNKVVIIGPGGGSDVLSALTFGNKDITAVEINSGIVSIMKNEMAAFNGRLYHRPEVHVVVDEGRAFLAQSREKVDFIQATFIDTYAAAASGTHTLNENYLYTTDAIHDYLDRLTDNGIISMSRWGGKRHGFVEIYRAVALAQEALRERGIKRPEDHIIVVQGPPKERGRRRGYQADGATTHMSTMLVSKTPFNKKQRYIINTVSSQNHFIPLWIPENPRQNKILRDMFRSQGSDAFFTKYYDRVGMDIRPVNDNQPFFFSMLKPTDYFWARAKIENFKNVIYRWKYGPVFALYQIFFTLMLLVSLLIVLPLIRRRKDILPLAQTRYFLSYFTCLGLGFMGIELGLMQKFSLFLGHPVYAMAVVLAALLLFSALGSLYSGRIHTAYAEYTMKVLVLLVAVLAIAGSVLPPLLHAMIALPFMIKAAIAIALIAPPGFLMGMLYPLGIKILDLHDKTHLIPWMWGLNTGFSVMASVLSLFLAMSFGFAASWYVFTAIYLAAAGCTWQLARGWRSKTAPVNPLGAGQLT